MILKFQQYNESIQNNNLNNGIILMTSEPYDISQFGQEKYGIYIYVPSTEKYLYLGDLRKYDKISDQNPYISYLKLNQISEKEPNVQLKSIDNDAMELINDELDKENTIINLTDDIITYRDKIKNNFGIII